MAQIEADDIPSVVSIAHLIRKSFPELEERAFAISEVQLTKENMPNLPLACVVLNGIKAVNQSNDVNTPVDIEEMLCAEFWTRSKNYAKADGGVSPFYAFQDYRQIMDRLFNALTGYFTPQRKPVRFISMDLMADEYCHTISFKFSVIWRWCAEEDDTCNPIKVKFKISPQELVQAPGGSLYQPPNSCVGQLPASPVNLTMPPAPNYR